MAAGDLCTLADVRLRMQKKTADTAQDALITSLIAPVSAAIMRWTEREFAPVTASAARVFEWDWRGEFVSLAPYDLRTVTTIQVDTDTVTPITLTTDEYRLWPKPPKDGTYLALRLKPLSLTVGRVVYRNREVTVTGAWGFPSVPSDVAAAAAATVVHWMMVNVAAFRRPDELPDGADPPRRGIPPEALQMLATYKRAVTG